MNLNTLKLVTRAARPSLEREIKTNSKDFNSYLIARGTQLMLGVLDVNGLATLASDSERDIPT